MLQTPAHSARPAQSALSHRGDTADFAGAILSNPAFLNLPNHLDISVHWLVFSFLFNMQVITEHSWWGKFWLFTVSTSEPTQVSVIDIKMESRGALFHPLACCCVLHVIPIPSATLYTGGNNYPTPGWIKGMNRLHFSWLFDFNRETE